MHAALWHPSPSNTVSSASSVFWETDMSEERDAQWDAFEKLGAEGVRRALGAQQYGEARAKLAREWLTHKEARTASDDRRKAIDVAEEANKISREANALAQNANSTAIEATASASRSADAARKNNGIALASLIIAVLAVIVAAIAIIKG
jgi:hypothetical protein